MARYLCRVGERGFFTTHWGWHHRGGIGLDDTSACAETKTHLQFSHPPVYVSPDPETTMLDATEATLEPLPWIGGLHDPCVLTVGGSYLDDNAPLSYDEVFIMTEPIGPCHADRQPAAARPRLHAVQRHLLRARPRIVLFDNTLEGASNDTLLGASRDGILGSCHNVPKTFRTPTPAGRRRRARRCRSATRSCSSTTARPHLPRAHEDVRVRPHRPHTRGWRCSPCVGTARWRKLDGRLRSPSDCA